MSRGGTQHAALGRAGAEVDAGGYVAAHLHPLRAGRQEVLNPLTGGVWYSQVRQFGHQSVWDDGVECRAVVHEEQPRVAPPLLQVA